MKSFGCGFVEGVADDLAERAVAGRDGVVEREVAGRDAVGRGFWRTFEPAPARGRTILGVGGSGVFSKMSGHLFVLRWYTSCLSGSSPSNARRSGGQQWHRKR